MHPDRRVLNPHLVPRSSAVERWSSPGCVRSRSRRSPRTWASPSRAYAGGLAQADIDEGKREGLSSDEGKELVELRRQKRVLEIEVEILKRPSAYFARENVLPE